MDYNEDVLVEVNVVYLYQTEEAIKIEDADCRQVWLPKVAVNGVDFDELEEGVEITVGICESLANKKGLL